MSLSVGVVPGTPTDLAVTEATKSYVVLSWKPPVQRGHEGVMYYVEKVRQNVNSIKYLIFPCVRLTYLRLTSIFPVFGGYRYMAEGKHWDASEVPPFCSV